MEKSITINGYKWRVQTVPPNSLYLLDRNGKFRVATTDISTKDIYLSSDLHGDFKKRVLAHELTHCVIFSYGLIRDIRNMVKPQYLVEGEEWMCNLLADYGPGILSLADEILDYI